MNNRFQLSSIDMMTFLIQAIVGVRILILPRTVAKVAATDSWISVILGGVIVLVLSLMLYWLGIKFPGKNGSQIVVKLLGGVIGKIGLVLIAVHTMGTMGFSLEVFTDSLKLFLLSTTPVPGIASILLLLGLYAFTRGLKTIATLANILLPQLLFWMGLLLILPIKRIEPQNLLPFLSNGIKPVFMGSLEVVDALYGFTIIAYIMPYFKDRKSTLKWIFPGIVIATGVYLGIISAGLMVFGSDEIVRLLYPTLSLAKSIELDFNLVERAESIFMIAWIIATFLMITLSLFVSYENLKVLFAKKNKLLIYGQIPVIWIFLKLSRNVAQINVYTQYINYLGRVLMLLGIPLLVLLTFIKERTKKNGV